MSSDEKSLFQQFGWIIISIAIGSVPLIMNSFYFYPFPDPSTHWVVLTVLSAVILRQVDFSNPGASPKEDENKPRTGPNTSSPIKQVFPYIAWLGSAVVTGFIITSACAATGNYFMDMNILWGGISVIAAVLFKILIFKDLGSGYGGMGNPEKRREEVVNEPQFTGSFDRDKGVLETTVRMVGMDRITRNDRLSNPQEYNVVMFRGELLDENGVPLDFVEIEISARTDQWSGMLHEGDRVRVEGKVENDGILRSENAFNYSTNSWVGKRR